VLLDETILVTSFLLPRRAFAFLMCLLELGEEKFVLLNIPVLPED
jgi:hypothetical protein